MFTTSRTRTRLNWGKAWHRLHSPTFADRTVVIGETMSQGRNTLEPAAPDRRPARRRQASRRSACAPRPSRSRPGLHVVATPIGNLGDISFRAVATLAAADAVIAEDTRVTKVLLAHYGISTPLVAYHEHNAAVMRPHLLARLRAGAALALVSDAGTPLVSDPGFKLVTEALAEGIAGHRGARRLGGAGRPGGGGPADGPLLLRGFPAAKSARAGGPHRGARAPFRARWCSSNRRAGWPRRSPIWRRCSAHGRPPWRAN